MKNKLITALLLAGVLAFSGCAAGQADIQADPPAAYEDVGEDENSESNNFSADDGESEGQNSEQQEEPQSGASNAESGDYGTESNESDTSSESNENTENGENCEQQEEVAASYAQYIKVTGTNVNIRKGAGTGYASLGSAEQNTLYACLGQSGEWYKTLYQNQTVYISAKYCEVVEIEQNADSLIESVINEGLKLMGVKYVYGAVRYHDGTGKLNSGFKVTEFDCSSLTQYIFYLGAGALLQVNTRTQIYQGEHVDKENLQRGDLMFFTNDSRYYNSGIERVGHVAVYLGDNYILHTSSDYAKIEQLTTKRWNYFLEARRMI